jgi:TonB-dependent SusC/RagA subfamily outer membrane receptor
MLQLGVLSAQKRVPQARADYVVVLWVIAAFLVTLTFAATYWRLRRASRRWPATHLHGQRVLVAPATGPLVLGLVRPNIVVPRWLLTRPHDEQRVILNHEIEHLEAGDQKLLAAACLLSALMPWNPAAWIILARIRLAIEIDCDARVLRSGVSPLSYGSLLARVAEASSPFLLGAMGIAPHSSHLRLRILAMQPRRFNRSIMRGAAAAAVGIVSLLAACEARVPTSADIDRMDGAAVGRVGSLSGIIPDSSVVWVVDGVPSTAAAAKRIPAEKLASISIKKVEGRPIISLRTKSAVGRAMTADTTRIARVNASYADTGRIARITMDSPDTTATDPARRIGFPVGAQPLVIIDGAPSSASALSSLSRDRIERVEVIKGESAIARYGASGTNGVILVTTKRGDGSQR